MTEWRQRKMKKILVIGIILLFFGVGIVSGFDINSTNSLKPINRGYLYVGGSGPGNYTTIQKAVDAAKSYDTIKVFPGTYIENVDIYMSQSCGITIIGVNGPSETILDAKNGYFGFEIGGFSKGVRIRNFTIRNARLDGVYITGTDYNNITDCVIKNNLGGIRIEGTSNGISEHNTFWRNIITANLIGISFCSYSNDNLVCTNHIIDNVGTYGIWASSQSNNNWIYNNYIDNPKSCDAWDDSTQNHWCVDPIIYLLAGPNICGGYGIGGNYWGSNPNPGSGSIYCTNSNTPYTIPGAGGNQDLHPIPGFELVFVLCAIAILVLIRKRKRLVNN